MSKTNSKKVKTIIKLLNRSSQPTVINDLIFKYVGYKRCNECKTSKPKSRWIYDDDDDDDLESKCPDCNEFCDECYKVFPKENLIVIDCVNSNLDGVVCVHCFNDDNTNYFCCKGCGNNCCNCENCEREKCVDCDNEFCYNCILDNEIFCCQNCAEDSCCRQFHLINDIWNCYNCVNENVIYPHCAKPHYCN